MRASNRNTLWAGVFVDELARAGLRAACIAPGSRSTPLTLAFAAHPDIAVHSLVDERGAGFFALGMALTGGRPVAVVCTSGTATANFHPAIVEAFYAQVPLLVLTTDRPHELRESGANQTIDQIKMYADHVRWFVDVALPEAAPAPGSLRYLRTLACRAVAVAQTPPAGPVHLNFPFRKPLEPTPVPDDIPGLAANHAGTVAFNGRPDGTPFTRISRGTVLPSAEQVADLAATIRGAARGLIVCGPRCPSQDFPEAVLQLAEASGYPVLADALSGVRFGRHVEGRQSLMLSAYETYLRPGAVATWPDPELILHFGVTPTSKNLAEYLAARPETHHMAITGTGSWHDDGHTLSDLIWADPEPLCRAVTAQLASESRSLADSTWLARFQHAEQRAWDVFDRTRQEQAFEGSILTDIVEVLPAEALLYVSNSLPVRHLDQFTRPTEKNLRVLANRGASGIDGTISSALGAAAAVKLPLVLVTGDLAFYHDLNGLLALQRCAVKATIVLINNDGGGIFHRLPVAEFDPPFTELFVTPHGLDFEPVVRMFGAEFAAVTTRTEFRRVLQASIGADISTVIELRTDASQHEHIRREIGKVVARELATTVDSELMS